MKKFTKEIRMGLVFIVALLLLYFGINFLKGINIFKPANSYVVVFEDVTGMLRSDPITVNGMKIGQVRDMYLDAQKPKQVAVHIQLDKGIRLKKGSELALDASMLGGATLLLEANKSTETYLQPGDTITGYRKTGMMDAINKVLPQVEHLVPKLDSILTGINIIINNPALNATLNNVEQLTADFAKSSKEIDKLLVTINKDLPIISKNLGNTVENFEQMSRQVRNIDITSTFNKLDSTMSNVQYLSTSLRSKDSSIGLLLHDRQMYDSLNMTISNMSLLMKDLRENPSRYINVKVF